MPDINIFKLNWNPIKFIYNPSDHNIEFIREFICYHQGNFAHYDFFASQKHSALEKELSKNTKDIKQITENINDLEQYMNIELENAFQESFRYIHRHFQKRSKYGPRVCVKAHNEDGQIVDLFRDKRSYEGTPYPLVENTGFNDVYNNGNWYICNNIPKCAKSGKYVNPRLDNRNTKNYKLSIIEKLLINLFRKQDNKWINCWNLIIKANGQSDLPKAEECYKSTLIIPLTLLGGTLRPEFKKHFNIINSSSKAIWGYLCFDHRSKNYFKKPIDVHCGYIFADIMFFYLITRMFYIDYSDTYKDAKKLIS